MPTPMAYFFLFSMELVIVKNGVSYTVLYDEEQELIVKQYCWWIMKNGYVCGYKKGVKRRSQKSILMHRLLIGSVPDGYWVDHINRVRSDNRKSNLRLATPAQSQVNKRCKNSLGYVGVYKSVDKRQKTQDKCFVAQLAVGGKHIFLGYYKTAIEAAMARDCAAKKHHGEFAVLNFP